MTERFKHITIYVPIIAVFVTYLVFSYLEQSFSIADWDNDLSGAAKKFFCFYIVSIISRIVAYKIHKSANYEMNKQRRASWDNLRDAQYRRDRDYA